MQKRGLFWWIYEGKDRGEFGCAVNFQLKRKPPLKRKIWKGANSLRITAAT